MHDLLVLGVGAGRFHRLSDNDLVTRMYTFGAGVYIHLMLKDPAILTAWIIYGVAFFGMLRKRDNQWARYRRNIEKQDREGR